MDPVLRQEGQSLILENVCSEVFSEDQVGHQDSQASRRKRNGGSFRDLALVHFLFSRFVRLCWQHGSVHSKGWNLNVMSFLLTFNQEGSQGGDKLSVQGGIMVAFKERIGDY